MENKEKKKEKNKLSKRQKQVLIITASLIAFLAIILTVALCLKENNLPSLDKENTEITGDENPEELPDPIIDPNGSGLIGGEEVTYEKIIPLVGNTTITPEREVLLESGIMKTIARTSYLIPLINENGSYYTDEKGDLVCREVKVRDYTGMRENLIIIANSFADDGYPIEPIWYAQRLYFVCYDQLSGYATDDLLEGLKRVFLKAGNTAEGVDFRASEIFALRRADECRFVFQNVIPPAEIAPRFYEVELKPSTEWKAEYEKYCIYNEWIKHRGDSEYNRNLESYLHIIVCKMTENGAKEHDIRLAQLIYTSYLADINYRSDWLGIILELFENGTPDYVILCETVYEVFGKDMNSNMIIANYYDGVSEFMGGSSK